MVRGLDVFREHFRRYSDQFILIGGTACDLVMAEAGDTFRATKDLDIVLCIEALDATFVRAFWEFVRSGGYNRREKASGQRRFYRFQKPNKENYPAMLELFSRQPDILSLAEGTAFTPVPVDEGVSSLSAILLDEDYYEWLRSGAREKDGLRFVGPEHLIPLKARAWIDLAGRKAQGEAVDEKNIKKHRNDVFRLYRVISPAFGSEIPERVREDMLTFITRMEKEHVDLQALGLRNANKQDVLADLRRLYCGN